MRKNEILVPHGTKKKIANDVGVNELTVRLALKGATDSENAKTIRKRAIEFYGGMEVKIHGTRINNKQG